VGEGVTDLCDPAEIKTGAGRSSTVTALFFILLIWILLKENALAAVKKTMAEQVKKVHIIPHSIFGRFSMKEKAVILLLISIAMFTGGMRKLPYAPDADTNGHTAPTAITAELNASVLDALPFSDQQSFIECQKGLIASDPDLRVRDTEGTVIWDQAAYGFVNIVTP
jgi:hypothetical protein